MFPSTHDITPAYLDTYCRTLYSILTAGNDVLLVSKPHFDCIETICREFTSFRKQMEFRFTIGSLNPVVTQFWEPGAPLPEERIRCLAHAGEQGYQNSVSMEPILEGKDAAMETFYTLAPLTSGTIWIGMMNDLENVWMYRHPKFGRQLKGSSSCSHPARCWSCTACLVTSPRFGGKSQSRTCSDM